MTVRYPHGIGIHAVVVVYNCELNETKTLKSLLRNFAIDPHGFSHFKLTIYDNSASAQTENLDIPFAYEYFHDPRNEGLAVAYNYAFKNSVDRGDQWLLLLDQDSVLPETFMANLFRDLQLVTGQDSIAAVVPKMRYLDKIFSPTRVFYGGIVRAIDPRHTGVYEHKNAFAIGSGSVIRISFLRQIRGFNEIFWMDCLDRWLFFMIGKMGRKVYVTASVIEHELSVMDFDKFMNIGRYRNILKYETIFMTMYASKVENLIFYVRLIKRAAYLFFAVSDRQYAALVLRHLMNITLRRTLK